MKRWIGVGLGLVLVVVVAVAVVWGNRDDDGNGGRELVTVRGVIGSEKQAFFDDPQVKAAFARHGLRVEVDVAGTRQIATSVDLGKYGFAFPSSVPAAEKIRQDRGAARTYAPFYSPMAIATFDPIVDLLAKAGVVRDSAQGQVFDIGKYLEIVKNGARWDKLPGNTAYPARKRVLLTTTDIRTSNSAAMYLALMSYVANGENVVSSPEQVPAVVETVGPTFLDQGYSETTSEAPFEDYLALGVGKTPMVMIYEAQYAARVFAGDGSIRSGMRLIYPAPTVLSKHTLVPFTPEADKVGDLLTRDPEFAALAARHGFRTADPKAFADLAAKHRAPVATELVDVVEPPAFARMEELIAGIERMYAGSSTPAG